MKPNPLKLWLPWIEKGSRTEESSLWMVTKIVTIENQYELIS
jgi:hypothetical protein